MTDDRAAAVLERVAKIDPLLVEASIDVDQTLLDWALSLSPRERLRTCTRATRALHRFQRVAPERS